MGKISAGLAGFTKLSRFVVGVALPHASNARDRLFPLRGLPRQQSVCRFHSSVGPSLLTWTI